jgi:hypothetical protein
MRIYSNEYSIHRLRYIFFLTVKWRRNENKFIGTWSTVYVRTVYLPLLTNDAAHTSIDIYFAWLINDAADDRKCIGMSAEYNMNFYEL